MRGETIQEKNLLLFELLPQEKIVSCVENAFFKLKATKFDSVSISDIPFPSQTFCSIFHELIVFEISTLEGWRAGKQNKESDLVHSSGLKLQIKTNAHTDGIAGNRHSSKNKYSDPSEYYICVNFIPNECICKVRAGWIDSDSWKPQNGNGNAAILKKDKLKSMPLLFGNYLKEVNLISIDGVGEKYLTKLHNEGIYILKDLFTIKNYVKAKRILNSSSIALIDEILLQIS